MVLASYYREYKLGLKCSQKLCPVTHTSISWGLQFGWSE